VSFHRYQVGDEGRISIANNPMIPARLVGVVTHISGLSTERATPAMHNTDDEPAFTNCNNGTCQYLIAPSDFTAIYNAGPVYQKGINGGGRVIGIIGEAEVNDADIGAFNASTGVTVPTPAVTVVPLGTQIMAPFTAPPNITCATNDNTGECGYYHYQGEATLDVLRAGSVAQGAALQLIVSPSVETHVVSDEGIFVATEYAVDGDPATPDVLNLSFINCEPQSNSIPSLTWDALFQQAAAEGMSVFVAAGDAAATSCQDKFSLPEPENDYLAVNAICASSWVTCVGGTEFNPNALPSLSSPSTCVPSSNWACSNGPDPLQSASGYILEGAWNDPMIGTGSSATYQVAGTGGGFSRYISAPSWQAPVNPTLNRAVPDVAFPASCNDGYFGCNASEGRSCVKDSTGHFMFAGMCGTSAASPSMAGVMALVDQANGNRQGVANPSLYALGADPSNGVFHDVTVSSSGVTDCDLYTASMCNNTTPSSTGLTGGTLGYMLEPGFDEVTGWGSINIGNLIANWVPSPSLSASPATITIDAPGESGTTTITVIAFPSGEVNFNCVGLPRGTDCSFGQLSSTNTVTLMITTTMAGEAQPSSRPLRAVPAPFALAMLLWFSYGLRRRDRWGRLLALFMLVLGIMGMVGCAKKNSFTPPGTSATVMVLATSGSTSAMTQIELMVQ
jgi:pseudomonalisin